MTNSWSNAWLVGQNGLAKITAALNELFRDPKVAQHHYSDVIMSAMGSQITGVSIICPKFVQAEINETIKTPRHWPLWGESTDDWWIPLTKGQ